MTVEFLQRVIISTKISSHRWVIRKIGESKSTGFTSEFVHLAKEGRTIRAGILIWVDWIAGAMAGTLMLSLRSWLAELFNLPEDLLLVMGLANLIYAGGSYTLAMRSRGDRVPFFRVVAVANIVWSLLCLVFAIVWFGQASLLGLGQLIGEAIFVGGLGVLEWRAARYVRSLPILEPAQQCSFCHRPLAECGPLVTAGEWSVPGTDAVAHPAICEECVEMCQAVFVASRGGNPQLSPTPAPDVS